MLHVAISRNSSDQLFKRLKGKKIFMPVLQASCSCLFCQLKFCDTLQWSPSMAEQLAKQKPVKAASLVGQFSPYRHVLSSESQRQCNIFLSKRWSRANLQLVWPFFCGVLFPAMGVTLLNVSCQHKESGQQQNFCLCQKYLHEVGSVSVCCLYPVA